MEKWGSNENVLPFLSTVGELQLHSNSLLTPDGYKKFSFAGVFIFSQYNREYNIYVVES